MLLHIYISYITYMFALASPLLITSPLENEIGANVVKERLEDARADNAYATSLYDNMINMDAAEDAEIKAEASRRVAAAAADIAAKESAKANYYANNVQPI